MKGEDEGHEAETGSNWTALALAIDPKASIRAVERAMRKRSLTEKAVYGFIVLSAALAIWGWIAFSGHHADGESTRSFRAGSISIESPWAPELPPVSVNGAVFMTIVNEGERQDRLIHATGAIASKVEIHDHIKDETGMLSMRRVQSIELLPGERVNLEPGGLHVMLMGLEHPLEKGMEFKLQLEFASGTSLEIDVPVGHIEDEGHSHSRH